MKKPKPVFYTILNTTLMVLVVAATCLLAVTETRAQSSMFADSRARETGDIITIVLAERTSAQRESEWGNQSDSRLGGSANANNSGGLNGQFALDAAFNRDASNRNESLQSDLLQGTLAATVLESDAAGNLRVSGERKLGINGETHVMKITGIVRPMDVTTANTVLSYKIANATIEYRRAGGIKRRFVKPARFAKFGGLALLAGALIAAK